MNLLPRFHRLSIRAEDERRLARILVEVGEHAPETATVTRATLAGDSRRLRGIPAVARGVAGVSPGSDPVRALLSSDRMR